MEVIHRAQHTEDSGKKFVVYTGFLLRVMGLESPTTTFSNEQPEGLVGSIWEHFKSKPENLMTYEIQGIGIDVDTGDKYVLYSPLYESGQSLMRNNDVTCLARPEEMFFSDVEKDEYRGPRFRKLT